MSIAPTRVSIPILGAIARARTASASAGLRSGNGCLRKRRTAPLRGDCLRISCRSLSSRDTGVDHAIPGPKTMDPGNTPLGKGFDLLGEDPEARPKCIITGYDPWGFKVGDIDARSSIVVFPNSFVLWKPRCFEEITVESLKLITLIKPPIDILLVGLGETMSQRLDQKIFKAMSAHGITLDFMSTPNACSTFNVLNGEDRRVAAAMLTLSSEDEPEFTE
ncbi:unnamed protein product [Choristocarpus tenellus]